jgi:predicted metal-dependent HD superfamily phosphohydrolase
MDLVAAWARVCQAQRAVGDVSSAGGRLLDAYGGPGRIYHDLRHLAEVLARVDELAGEAENPDLVRLAAWFHDAVYVAQPAAGGASGEELSARLAELELAGLGLPVRARDEVARLVRLTARHAPAEGDHNGAVLCDADLAVLARDPAGYAAYVADVRREYAAVPEPAFRAGRAAILRALLEAPVLFRTPLGRSRWEAPARANLVAELRTLDG